MNYQEALNLIKKSNNVAVPIYLPVVGRDLMFSPLLTGDQKILAKIAIGISDYDADLLRMALFEKMLLESQDSVKPSMLTMIDMVSFIASLKYQVKPTIALTTPCSKNCDGEIASVIDLAGIINNCRSFKFVQSTVENGDYKFVLNTPSWFDVMILRESLNQTDGFRFTSADMTTYFAFNKICLHISRMWIGGMEITTDDQRPFGQLPVPDRIRVFDDLDQSVTIDMSNGKSLIRIVGEHFDEIKMQNQIFNGVCTHSPCPKCGRTFEGGLSFDSFFGL